MSSLLLLAFATALGVTALATPLMMVLAKKCGAWDHPDARKIHSTPVTRWGGGALALGILSSLSVLWLFSPFFQKLLKYKHKFFLKGEFAGFLSIRDQFTGILLAAGICVGVGMWDDRKPLPALVKLFAQIIAAYVAMMYGVRMTGLVLPQWGFVEFSLLTSQVVTVLWLLGFMNAINLADGLDGLAAGLVTITAVAFMFVALLQVDTKVLFHAKQLTLAAVLAASVAGAALGFLFFNFFPARVFMGDGGALLLGFLLGAISVVGTLKTSAVIAFLIPVIVVAIPASDALYAVFRRIRQRRGLFMADRGHFHHRLLDNGWTQREVVFLAYVLTLVLAVTALLLTFFRGRS